MSVSHRARSLLLATLLVLSLAGCGGGGGGGGGSSSNPNPGNDPLGGKFGAVDGPLGSFLPGINSTVVVVFNKKVDPDTVTAETLNLVTITDPAGQATAPGGVLGSYTVEVADNRVLITPTVEFDQENITFGFIEQALFEISFSNPDSGESITSVSGQPISNPSKTFFFRTPSKAVDKNPGFPKVRAWFVDDTDGLVLPDLFVDANEDSSLYDDVVAAFPDPVEILPPSPTVQGIAASPIRDAIFVFDDAILPQSVLNPIDGSSPSVRVLINTATPPAFAPIIAPADLTFLHQQDNLTIVRWRSKFAALPPGGFLIYEVTSNVQDLACNSKVSSTGDASPSLSALVSVDGGVDSTLYSLIEPFDDDAKANIALTSASWAGISVGQLVPVGGGGRGFDGPLVVDPDATSGAPGDTTLPLAAIIDYDAKQVFLPTVREVGSGVFEPRTWELTRLRIPTGWVLGVLTDRDGDGIDDPREFLVQSPGHPLDGLGSALAIRCTETIDIDGTISVAGRAAQDVVIPGSGGLGTYFGAGGPTTKPSSSGGSGGRGGDAILSSDTNDDGDPDTVLLALVSPPVDATALPFEAAISKRRGVTGRSTGLTATTLRDELKDLSVINTNPVLAAMLAAGELRLQPNVGIGSPLALNSGTANEFIDENHPTFVVEKVEVSPAGATTITIVSDEGQSMLAASGNIGNGYAPIAASGDSYLLGRAAGATGGDAYGVGRGGLGAEPYLVVNEGALGVTTTGGGGGGGGSLSPGGSGGNSGPASDITVNQRGMGNLITNGMSLDESAGAPGGLGALRGTVVVVDGTTLDLATATSGPDPSDLAGAPLVGSAIVPGAPNDGWMFRIASFDGTTFVVDPIEAPEGEILLTTGPAGFDGPGLTATSEVSFVVVPPEGVGGGGGGGAGTSITGTVNHSPDVLPIVTPGAAGGAGGGGLLLESALDVILRNHALLSARGGDGGGVTDASLLFAGGGAGGGGSIGVRAGRSLGLFQGARISAEGGDGGSQENFGAGGEGGEGWLRLETADDDIVASQLAGFTTPTAREENVGRFLGLPQGVGVSRFYNVGLANPDYESVLVTYGADTDGDDTVESPLTWRFDAAGADGGPEDFDRPPFRFQFNPTGVNETGQQDVTSASPTFYEAYDLVSARTGLAYDALADVLVYSVGEGITGFHLVDDACLGTGCDALPLSTIPGVGDGIDVVSIAVGGVDGEIFMLERGTGRVIVLDGASAAYLRSIHLPAVIEGGMTVLSDGVDADADRLLLAANREDVLVSFRVRDPDAVSPSDTDYTPNTFLSAFGISRDGVALADIELTGLSYDVVTDRVWCVDAPTGTVFEIDVSPGNEGTSTSGTHAFARLTSGGQTTLLSSIAYDGSTVWVVHATDVDATTLIGLDPVDLMADEFALPSLGSLLPETARSIGDGDVYVRFRLAIDGTFTDEAHPGGAVSFRDVSIDEVELTTRNASF